MNTNLLIACICIVAVPLFFWGIPFYFQVLGHHFGKGVTDYFNESMDKQFEVFFGKETITEENKDEE